MKQSLYWDSPALQMHEQYRCKGGSEKSVRRFQAVLSQATEGGSHLLCVIQTRWGRTNGSVYYRITGSVWRTRRRYWCLNTKNKWKRHEKRKLLEEKILKSKIGCRTWSFYTKNILLIENTFYKHENIFVFSNLWIMFILLIYEVSFRTKNKITKLVLI